MAKVKISKKKLSEAIEKAVKQKVLSEGSHFTALRNIEYMVGSIAMELDKNLVDALGLLHPDHMQPELQAKFLAVVDGLKEKIKEATMEAARALINFPHQEENKGAK